MTKNLYPEFAVLLVDDEPGWLRSLRYALARAGQITHVLECDDSRQVMKVLERAPVGLVLLDLTMPHLSGEELLERIRSEHPEMVVMVVSGMNQLETAVRCMKAGAYDYFVKTTEEDRLVAGVLHAIRMIELQRENQRVASNLQSGSLQHPKAFASVVTRDRAMLGIFAYVETVARSAHPILLTGESGTGKELVAWAAHELSGRKGPLVAMNVAGLDDNVFSDTLFGHSRGAFTGADQVRHGLIEEAAGGTLFLDEIGDLGIPSQVKLLRLAQEGEYFPLGSDRPKRSQARLVAATHQDLAAKQAAGAFRRDLYYRLRTHHVNLPPLRDRKEDIPLLLEHFLAAAAAELGKRKPTAPPQLAQLLGAYGFPGNIRELRSMVFDAVSRHTGKVLSMESFIAAMGQPGEPPPAAAGTDTERNPFQGVVPLPTFREALDLLIGEAMSRSGGNQTIAARLLGVSQPTMSKRLKVLRTK